jgi:hypothetical protein
MPTHRNTRLSKERDPLLLSSVQPRPRQGTDLDGQRFLTATHPNHLELERGALANFAYAGSGGLPAITAIR